MQELDPRIVQLAIEIDGQLKIYNAATSPNAQNGLAISASGTKYANSIQDEVEIKIANLDAATRNYLLTQTSPFNPNRTPKLVILSAGRVSTGVFEVFRGNITATAPSQPPDIALTIRALTGDDLKGKIIARTQPPLTKASTVAQQIAQDTNTTLIFQATDTNLTNYNYNGAALKQIDDFAATATNMDIWQDGNNLIVKDQNVPLSNKVRILNLTTGMIGIPEVNEQGVKVKFLLDNQTTLGGSIQLTSEIYPAINGIYEIYKLGFNIASRAVPFYWIAECKRPGQGSISKNQVIKKRKLK